MDCTLYESELLTKEDIEAINKEHEGFFIEGLTFSDQRAIVKSIASTLFRTSIEKKGVEVLDLKRDVIVHINKELQNLQDLIDAEEVLQGEDSENTIRSANKLINKHLVVKQNIDTLFNHAKDLLSTLEGSVMINMSDETIDSIIESDEENESNASFERTTFGENFYFELNTKNTSSSRIRKFLAFVPKYIFDEKGNKETVTTLIGTQDYLEFDYVFNELHRILVGLKPSKELILKRLQSESDTANETKNSNLAWLDSFIQYFNSPIVKNITRREFVSEMTKHKIEMQYVSYSKQKIWDDKKLNKYHFDFTLRLHNDNSGSISNRLLRNWKKDHSLSNVVIDGVYSKQEKQILLDQVKEIQLSKNKLSNQDKSNKVYNILASLGITINRNFIEGIFLEGNVLYVGGNELYGNSILSKGGALEKLIDDIKDSVEVENGDFFKNTFIKALATASARYEQNEFSESFRVGDKTIYTYSMNQYMVNRYRDLIQDKTLRDKLSNSIFSAESLYLSLLNNKDTGFSDWFNYGYVSLNPLKKAKGKRSDNITEIGELDYEVTKIGHLNSGITYQPIKIGDYTYQFRKAEYFFPTTSDKPRVMSTKAIAVDSVQTDLQGNSMYTKNALELFYNSVIVPELNRIYNTQGTDFKELANLSTFDGSIFYLIPELNSLQVTEEGKTELLLDVIKGNPKLSEVHKSQVLAEVNKILEREVINKIEVWKKLGVIDVNGKLTHVEPIYDSKQKDKPKNERKSRNIKETAMDMVFNYALYDTNMFQLIIGDPSQYFKKDLDGTYTNITKRLAGEIAPRIEMEGDDYIQIFADDITIESSAIEYLKELYKDSPEVVEKYQKMKSTDAQEYTTWKEHLNILLGYGRITDEEYKEASTAFAKGENPSKEVFDAVLQPLKPIYVYNDIISVGNMSFDKKTYIKSSSFPLIPTLTKGLQIDKLRKSMEALEAEHKKGVRLAYSSAVKVGFPAKKLKLNKDTQGNFVDNIDLKDTWTVLKRAGFGIQQDIPYDENKSTVNKGTQELKLLWANYYNPKLHEEYTNLYKQLYLHGKRKLDNELKVNGKLDNKKLSKILIKELKRKGETNKPLYDGLKVSSVTGDFITPLWLSPYSDSYMSLINSIVKNHIVAHKLPGKSFVLGSQAGFKPEILEGEEGKIYIKEHEKSIIVTDSYNDELGLQPQREENGIIRGAQVFISFKFRDNEGNLLDINNFTFKKDGKLFIDHNKLPKELLESFGFRIPTQLHASMSYIEIVGFLPKSCGDLIIAPAEFTIQMGSDFDVDKLYTYMYSTTYDNKTKSLSKKPIIESYVKLELFLRMDLERLEQVLEQKGVDISNLQDNILNKYDELESIYKDSIESILPYIKAYKQYTELEANYLGGIHNRILDIHIQVMKDKSLQGSIHSPLGMGLHTEMIKKLDKAIEGKTNLQSIIFDEYQKKKFYDGTSGKQGCLGYGTKVLMYDGSFKEVQDVVVGDQLMGVDSTPRNVVELKRGIEQMYLIYQNKGITYRVNESHLLSLKYKTHATYSKPTRNGKRFVDYTKLLHDKTSQIVNIKVKDLLQYNKTNIKRHYGYQNTGIEFSHTPVTVDPYYVGLWLGDGSCKDFKEVGNQDKEIIEYLRSNFGIRRQHGKATIVIDSKEVCNNMKSYFNTNLVGIKKGTKSIPKEYLYNSREIRLQLLAGLIDSDGNYNESRKIYEISQKYETITNDIVYLLRSLGFKTRTTIKKLQPTQDGRPNYINRITFIPECPIPVLLERKRYVGKSSFKDRLLSSIRLEKDIVDSYYGFVLDGDHLFMLEDFTVTHNTGMFSIDSVFNVLAQNKGLTLMEYYIDEEGKSKKRPITVKFGNKYTESNGDLSSVHSLKKDKPRYKTEVIAASQNLSVDNANEQGMYKINMNQHTFAVYSILNFLGFEEDISDVFMAQPIIIEYAEGMRNNKSILKESNPNAEQQLVQKLIDKYSNKLYEHDKDYQLADFKGLDASNTMLSLIEKGNIHKDFGLYQAALLEKFMYLKEIEKPMSPIKQLLNIDSKGFNKNMYINKRRLDTLYDMSKSLVYNAKALFGNYHKGEDDNIIIEPTTNAGFDNIYGTKYLVDSFGEYFLESNTGLGFNDIVVNAERIAKKDDRGFGEKQLVSLKTAYKNYLLSNLNYTDIDGLRKELFLNKEKGSFYSDLTKLRESKYGKENKFLNSLDVNFVKQLEVDYNNSGGDNFDESAIYKAFIDLFRDATERNGVKPYRVAEKLIAYSLLRGGNKAQQFIKFIPVTVLNKLVNVPKNNYSVLAFVDQWIKHNPENAVLVEEYNELNKTDILVPGFNPSYIRVNKKEGTTPLYTKIGENTYRLTDELGVTGIDEYTPKQKRNSIFKENQVNVQQLTDLLNPLSEEYIKEVKVEPIVEPRIVTTQLLDLNYDSLTGLLNSITNLKEEYPEQAKLASILSTSINNETTIKLSDQEGNSFYDSNNNYITIYKNNLKTNEQYLTTILHEVLHSLSVDLIRAYETGEDIDPKVRESLARLNGFRNQLVDKLFSTDVSKIVEYYVRYTESQYKEEGKIDSILRNPMLNPRIRQIIERTKNYLDNKDNSTDKEIANILANPTSISEPEAKVYYSMLNLREFVAVSGSYGKVRDALMRLSDGKYVDKIKNFFKELLELLGIYNKETQKFLDDIFKVSGIKEEIRTTPVDVKTDNKTIVDKSLSWAELKDLPVYSDKGVMVMRKQGTNEHFGNPFTGSGIQGLVQMPTVASAVQAYKDWLEGYQFENPELIPNGFIEKNEKQRQWILSQIAQGKLYGQKLLYMKDKGEYYSHADALRDIINSKKEGVEETFELPEFKELEEIGKKLIEKCKGSIKPIAKDGMRSSITKGSKWKLVKDLKGLPTHAQGGVDLVIDKGKVHFSNGKSTMYAKYGMKIPKKQQDDLNNSEKKSIFTKGLEWYQIQMPCGGYAENGIVIPRKKKEVEPMYSVDWKVVDNTEDYKKYAKCGCQIRNNSVPKNITNTKYGRK